MSDFKQRLTVAADKGGLAWAYAKLVVHNDARDFAELVSRPGFDIVELWDDELVERHIQFQEERRR